MTKMWEVLFAGEGGQGLVVSGIILAKAAVKEGKNAVQGQTYGIQTRGGFSKSEVVIAEGEVYYPKCRKPNVAIILSKDAFKKTKKNFLPETLVIYDETIGLLEVDDATKVRSYPLKQSALELGNERVINSLALGVLLQNYPIISEESMEWSIVQGLPQKVADINIKAFRHGLTLAANYIAAQCN